MTTQPRTSSLSSRDKDNVSVYVNERYDRARRKRFAVEQDWWANKAFIRGLQWLDKSSVVGTKVQRQRKAWEARSTVNLMFTTERVVVAKISAHKPRPVVSAATNTDEDREAARGLEHALKYHWRKQDMDVEYIRFLSELWSTGGGWWKVVWDPEAGERLEVDDALADEMGISKADRVQFEGDLVVDACSPFDVYVDPGAPNDKQARWIIHVHHLHVDAVWERWGVEVQPEDLEIGDRPWTAMDQSEDVEDMALVKEYWERPSKAYPGGRRYVVCGNTVLEKEEPKAGTPEAIDSLPFIYIPFYPDTDSFYGITPVTFSREMQAEINKTVSLITEQARLNVHGKWLTPQGSKIKISNRPGEIVEYNRSLGMPTWVRGDPVNPSLLNLVEFFRKMKQFVDGIHDSSQGAAEGASQSGRAVVFQSEEDNTKLGPTVAVLGAGMKRLGRLILETWQKNADMGVTYRVIGENASSQAHSIEAGNIRYSDVEFQMGSNLPDNSEARRQTIMELFQVGLVEPKTALEMLEFGDLASAFGGDNLDRQRARNENEMLMEGEPVQPMQHDDHAAHLEVHIQAMKQDKWFKAPPEIQAAFMEHINQTAALMQGGAPPPGAEPQMEGGGSAPQTTPGTPGMQMQDGTSQGELQPAEVEGLAAISGV